MTEINGTSHNSTNKNASSLFGKPSTAELISLLCLSCFGTLLNSMIFTTIVFTRRLRMKATNVFVISFSVSQFLVAGVLIPLYCFYRNNSIYDHLSALIVISYSTHLTSVTYERLQSVKNSLRYHQIMPRTKAIKMVTSCWLISLIAQLIPFTYNKSEYAELLHKCYLVCLLFIFLILPMVFLFYTYVVIFKELLGLLKRDSQRRPSKVFTKSIKEDSTSSRDFQLSILRTSVTSDAPKSPTVNTSRRSTSRYAASRVSIIKPPTIRLRSEVKLASVFAIISATYILSWGPVLFMTFLEVIERKDIEPEVLNLLSAILIGVNSVTDPVVYGLMLKDVRHVLIAVICRRQHSFKR